MIIDMGRSSVILVLTLFISLSLALAASAVGAATARRALLRDGFGLAGVDGKLTPADGNDRWSFELDSDLSDDKSVIEAGSVIELLPSAALERMIADANDRSSASYRLWGRVTKYTGKNFIFPVFFLPLSKVKQPQPQQSQQQEKQAVNEPNDVLTIPDEIVKRLKARKIIRTEQLKKGLELKQDCILADRTGFISPIASRDAYRAKVKWKKEEVKTQAARYEFVLDALGRNIQRISFSLLPCQALEQARQKQSAEPDLLRFKAAGIVTRYKGRHYLLLQRAVRVYSHENFDR